MRQISRVNLGATSTNNSQSKQPTNVKPDDELQEMLRKVDEDNKKWDAGVREKMAEKFIQDGLSPEEAVRRAEAASGAEVTAFYCEYINPEAKNATTAEAGTGLRGGHEYTPITEDDFDEFPDERQKQPEVQSEEGGEQPTAKKEKLKERKDRLIELLKQQITDVKRHDIFRKTAELLGAAAASILTEASTVIAGSSVAEATSDVKKTEQAVPDKNLSTAKVFGFEKNDNVTYGVKKLPDNFGDDRYQYISKDGAKFQYVLNSDGQVVSIDIPVQEDPEFAKEIGEDFYIVAAHELIVKDGKAYGCKPGELGEDDVPEVSKENLQAIKDLFNLDVVLLEPDEYDKMQDEFYGLN